MNKKVLPWMGILLTLFLGSSILFTRNINAENTTVGALQFSPSSVKNGGAFNITLTGASSIPANTVTKLYIDTDEGSGYTGYKYFGTWLDVGELSAGISRTMNCSAYSSYSPSGSVNVTGKTLSQKLYVVYGNTGSQSAVATHTKDCSAAGSGGVSGGGGASASGTGTNACRVDNLVLPPNSTDRVDIEFDGYMDNINFSANALSGSGITSVSAGPNIKIARLKNGSGRERPVVQVGTGPDFSGSASYTVACNYRSNPLTAIGTVSAPIVSNPSGKVKLTQMKDLKEVLFPRSACDPNVLGCQTGFELGAPVSVMMGANPPALVGADVISLYPASAKGNTANTRLFNLSDPMNPVNSGLSGQVRAGGDFDTFADFGSYLSLNSVAYSQDKKVWAATNSQNRIFVWKDGKRYFQLDNNSFNAIQGIIKVGYSYILLTSGGEFDISNGMQFSETQYDALIDQYKDYHTLIPAPAGFPRLPKNERKIILGDSKHILAIVDSPNQFGTNPGGKRRLAIYSTDSPNVVVEQELPAITTSVRYGTIPVSDGEYIYLLKSPQSMNVMNQATYGPRFATIYKFDYNTKKITEVVKDVALSPGYIIADTAFGANTSEPGIVVSSYTYTDLAFSIRETKIQAYLISDLIRGVGADTLSNAPVWRDTAHKITSLASLAVGGATYVYDDGSRVYKLELGTAGPGNPPATHKACVNNACAIVSGAGTDSCSTIGSSCSTSGGGGAVDPLTYNCNFDLTFTPTSLKVKLGTYYANYTVKANSTSANPFCTVTIIPPSQGNIRSDSLSTMVVSPNGQASMLLNVSRVARGTYTLPIKAAAKGVPMKTYTVTLTVE